MTEELTPAQHALRQEYLDLLHAVQTGIAALIETDVREGSVIPIQSSGLLSFYVASDRASLPLSLKHMRVGIDSAHISDAAIVRLLIEKGVITYDEYYASLVRATRDEIEDLKSILGRKYERDPSTITLL